MKIKNKIDNKAIRIILWIAYAIGCGLIGYIGGLSVVFPLMLVLSVSALLDLTEIDYE